MTVRRRTASHQVSAALLDAAETVLDRDGTGGVTIRAVAHQAAVSPTSRQLFAIAPNALRDAMMTSGAGFAGKPSVPCT